MQCANVLLSRVVCVAALIVAAACDGGKSAHEPLVVATVVVTPVMATIEVGASTQLTASAQDAGGNAVTSPVTWSSAETSVATVSSTGLVAGVAPGSATITAASGGKQAIATVVVTPPSVSMVTTALTAMTLEVGLTTQATATLRDARGNVLAGRATSWSSDNPAIATVSQFGLVTALAVGSTNIVATSEGKTGGATLAVIPAAVATITTTLAASMVEEGSNTQASAMLKDSQGNVLTGRSVVWSTGSATVATVSQAGVVTAVVAGSTPITATSEGKSGSATLTVVLRTVNSVNVTLNPSSLTVGGQAQATFVARDINGNALSGRSGSWSSTNTQVATVSSSTGMITTVSPGVTTITATVEGRTGSAVLTVTAVPTFGTITGVVTAADGVTPIPDATVEVQQASNESVIPRPYRSNSLMSATVSTKTGPDGRYTLSNVPSGPQVLIAYRGTFTATLRVKVRANQTTPIRTAMLVSTGKLAYVPGDYDSIEIIVRNVLGNQMDMIDATDLSSSAVTSQYRIIFLNCGLDEGPASDAAVITNLRAFLQAGGTIYASDWAAVYVKKLFPGFDFDRVGDDQATTATITDPSLQAFVGKTSVSIVYDLVSWAVLLSIPSNANVLLRGSYTFDFGMPSTNQPLAIVIPSGAGRLVYTTFHNETGATPDQIAVLRHLIYLP